ncbi:MAG TPA: hypothetical protein VGH38_32985 [Bryobacteraceae bacterium]|jgi:hypothetical protein
MWAIYTVIAYFLLALLIPISWALGKTWRFARANRQLTCPAIGGAASVGLDPWFAMRQHAIGDNELRVLQCSRWPEHGDCSRQCLRQIAPRR